MSYELTKFIPHSISLTPFEIAGVELSDGGRETEQYYGQEQKAYLLACLTRRQQRIAVLLTDGFTRREIAGQLRVSVQAIHQIVLRIRKRLREKGTNGTQTT